MKTRETYSVSLELCRQRPIFPARLQASIFGTVELNFRVRNGNGWTLYVKITDLTRAAARISLCQHRPIFPARLQASIVGTAELNFRVRNGNGWTLCVKNTDCFQPSSLSTILTIG